MANTYEEKLGTEKMLPLILKMALPSVAAQLVNLLYSIVDRIYIGHIPEIGTDALAGIGVTSSVIMLVAAFANIVGGGGAPLASIALGKGDRERAKRIRGCHVGCRIYFHGAVTAAHGRFRGDDRLFYGLPFGLYDGHAVCDACDGAEHVYKCSGQTRDRYAVCHNRRASERRA